jgi:hypothetical protein
LTYFTKIFETRKWYISHEILYFEKSEQGSTPEKVALWENLILIQANDPEEAYRKAVDHGRLSEEPIKIDGEDGHCRFLGLKDLVLVYDQLEDGAELEWQEREVNSHELGGAIRPKEKLHAFNLRPDNDQGSI